MLLHVCYILSGICGPENDADFTRRKLMKSCLSVGRLIIRGIAAEETDK